MLKEYKMMRAKLSIFICCLLPLFILQNTIAAEESVSVETLIAEVKQSSGDERRKAMNRLKLKLRSVNAETRRQAMLQLQRSFSGVQRQHQGNTIHTGNMMKHTSQALSTQGANTPSSARTPGSTPKRLHSSPKQQMLQKGR